MRRRKDAALPQTVIVRGYAGCDDRTRGRLMLLDACTQLGLIDPGSTGIDRLLSQVDTVGAKPAAMAAHVDFLRSAVDAHWTPEGWTAYMAAVTAADALNSTIGEFETSNIMKKIFDVAADTSPTTTGVELNGFGDPDEVPTMVVQGPVDQRFADTLALRGRPLPLIVTPDGQPAWPALEEAAAAGIRLFRQTGVQPDELTAAWRSHWQQSAGLAVA